MMMKKLNGCRMDKQPQQKQVLNIFYGNFQNVTLQYIVCEFHQVMTFR